MPDIPYDQISGNIRITGSQEDKYVDTQDDNSIDGSVYTNRILSDSAILKTDLAFTAFRLVTAGSENDTITVSINGKTNFVFTLSASDAGNLLNTAASFAEDFNNSSSHSPPWFAKIKEWDDDYVVITISAIRAGEGDAVRPTHGHFSVSSTGTTVVSALYDNIVKRSLNATGICDETHPHRIHLLTNSDYKQPFKKTWFQSYLNSGGSIEMNVDGSSSDVIFGYFPDGQYDLYITELRLVLQDNGSDMFDFMGISGGLGNGVQLDFKSRNTSNIMMTLQTTIDILSKFAYPMDNSGIIKQSYNEHFVLASRKFTNPLVIKRQYTYPFDDYVVIRVKDDLTSLDKLRCVITGYKEGVVV